MMPTISATATFKINPNTSGLLARVGTGLFDGVSAGAKLIEDAAIQRCPVDTGALVSSISTSVTRGIQSATAGGPISSSIFAVQGIVAPHEPYAAYVEYGTGRRGASSAGAGKGPYSENWPGMVAQPYMRPALDENRDAVVETVRESVKSALG